MYEYKGDIIMNKIYYTKPKKDIDVMVSTENSSSHGEYIINEEN